MALSLPYPSLTFVPLDILTAEEMNQIVANYEFISNQFPIGTGNINNGAITSDKLGAGAVTAGKIGTKAVKDENIDWTSMDTGWLNCTYKSTYYEYGPTDQGLPGPLQVRVKAGIIYLRGTVGCTGAWPLNIPASVATLPSSITPLNKPLVCSGRCSQEGVSWWQINKDGEIVCTGLRGINSSHGSVKVNWASINTTCGPVD